MITTLTQLTAAVKAAKAGDGFSCQGVFQGFAVKTTLPNITISGGSFPDLLVQFGGGVSFINSDIVRARVQGGKNVNFDKCRFSGNKQTDDGLHIQGASDNVGITNSEFFNLFHALIISSSNNVNVSKNDFHDLRDDGIVWANVANLKISKNSFKRFASVVGDHPDCIQGNPANSKNVSITWNLLDGELALLGAQGIFVSDATLKAPVVNLDVSNNFIRNLEFTNAAMIAGVSNGTISNNTIINKPSNPTYLRQGGVNSSLTYLDNQLSERPVGGIISGFQLVTMLADNGEGMLQAWLDKRALPGLG